jgi:hypothetical protein
VITRVEKAARRVHGLRKDGPKLISDRILLRNYDVTILRSATRAKRGGGPGRTRTSNQTVMSEAPTPDNREDSVLRAAFEAVRSRSVRSFHWPTIGRRVTRALALDGSFTAALRRWRPHVRIVSGALDRHGTAPTDESGPDVTEALSPRPRTARAVGRNATFLWPKATLRGPERPSGGGSWSFSC